METNVSNTSHLDNITLTEDDITLAAVWGFWTKMALVPVIMLVGCVGNTLSLVVMKSKRLRQKSYSHFLSALAIFDTINLVIRLVNTVDELLVDIWHQEGVFSHFNNVTCKMYNFFDHIAYLMSSWLVVLMAIERLLAVCFPFKTFRIRQQAGAVGAIFVLFITVSISQMFRLIMIEHLYIDYSYNVSMCTPAEDYLEIYTTLQVYLYQFTFAFSMPLIIVLLCNSLVIYQIVKVRRELRMKEKQECISRRNSHEHARRHKTTGMLLTVTFTYIATLLPLFTLSIIIDATVKYGDRHTAMDVYITLRPFLEVCVAISLINYAVNFFIYVLSGESFRYELIKLLTKKKSQRRSATLYLKHTKETIDLV